MSVGSLSHAVVGSLSHVVVGPLSHVVVDCCMSVDEKWVVLVL